jgi:uncharacterized membrane-anchored protein
MTTEHNSPTGEAEAVRLAEKHAIDFRQAQYSSGVKVEYTFTAEDVAALIADVRQQSMEKWK